MKCTLRLQSLFWEQVKAIGDVPAPRSGHTFTKVGTRYLLFGGMGCQSTLHSKLNLKHVCTDPLDTHRGSSL